MAPLQTAPRTRRAESLRDLIDCHGLRAVYQPIIELDSGCAVAYEALARGPAGSPLESPGALFGAAAREGMMRELDQACRDTAVSGALEAGLSPPLTLFVNAEPTTLGGVASLFAEEARIASGQLRVVVELTERDLTARPAEVLRTVAWLRERGCGIALDDVGADERSLALLPLVAPDVVKLDMSLVQERNPSTATAHVVNAAAAEVERSGAALLAEGIETEEHLMRARSYGATLGQGWLFGKPGALPQEQSGGPEVSPVELRPTGTRATGTPFDLVTDERSLRLADKRLLLALSRQLEAEAETLSAESVVLAAFQDDAFFTPSSRQRYEHLAERSALVAALGVGIGERPAAGVRGGRLEADDPLRGEWDVVVISPHFAGAFVARDMGDSSPDFERRFEFFLTYDRDLVVSAARILVERIVPFG